MTLGWGHSRYKRGGYEPTTVPITLGWEPVGREVAYNVRGPGIESHQEHCIFLEIKYTLLLQYLLV
jgi:hypothetical protein